MIHRRMSFTGLRRFALRGMGLALFLACAAQAGQAAYLTIPTDYIVGQGQDVTITVNFINDSSTDTLLIDGADLSIAWDPGVFTYVSFTPGTLTQGFLNAVNTLNPGAFYYTSFNPVPTNPTQLGPNSQGSIASITLHSDSAAPLGLYPINLLEANPISGAPSGVTDPDGNNIPLNPNPTDGPDPGVDGAITVVPEPSSLALMGLGLTTCFLGYRRRLARA